MSGLVTGLQNRVQRFESASDLQNNVANRLFGWRYFFASLSSGYLYQKRLLINCGLSMNIIFLQVLLYVFRSSFQCFTPAKDLLSSVGC